MSVMTTRGVIFRLVMTRSYICSMYMGPKKASIFIKKLNITAVKKPDLVARKASESRFDFAICTATAGPVFRAARIGTVMAVWTSRSSWEDDNDIVYPTQPVQGKNVELSRI